MKKKYRLKKEALIFLTLVILVFVVLIVFLMSIFKNKSYSIEYNIDDFKINENYDNNEKLYYYEIKYKDNLYNFVQESKYIKDKKLINKVENYEDEEYICIKIKSEYFEYVPLCSKENENIDYHLVSDNLKEKLKIEEKEAKEEKVENYTIYSESHVLVWSYKGFNSIRGNKIKFIKLFNRDIYNLPLATKVNNYLVIPDYEQEYSFNKVYIINLENDELDEWKLEESISFESYILGVNDRSIFWMDTKNKKEFELVPHKKRMRVVAKNKQQGIIYQNGEMEKYQVNKIILNNMTFSPKEVYKYSLKKDKKIYLLYLNKENIETLISDKDIKDIIYIQNDSVYYLVDDILYKYNVKEGETKLIKYPEWEFNYENLIFINE